jgi:hypothetical protein
LEERTYTSRADGNSRNEIIDDFDMSDTGDEQTKKSTTAVKSGTMIN